ncbi:MAG: ABC transporter permease subunit [Planctomycetia bacterium]|nr:ABC transporter permease subunit [Planctomycetia bacterium]
MHSQATFTGRPRRRTTHSWVKAGDRLARVLITVAGVGTIAAVLLVGIFLLAVAVPLFRPARIAMAGKASTQAVAIGSDPQRLVSMGADDSGILAWFLEVSGTAGAGAADRIRVFNPTDGTLLLERSAAESGCQAASAIRILPGSLEGVVGYKNGSFRTGRIGLESKFLAATDLPAGLGALELGAAKVHDNGVILRGDNNRYARVELVTDLATEPREPLGARVVDVDITRLSTGPLVAAIDEKGNVRVEAIASRRNLLTDQVVTTASGATIAAASFPGSLGRFVRVSELGDQLFVIAADGLARRYEIRSIESPTLMESFAAAPQGNGVVAVARLFGGNALAIADTAGNVRVWFATRAADAEAADGLQMVAAKTFPATKDQAAITAIAPSPRSRLFAVADASGGIRMLQSTNASTVLSLQSTVAGGLATPAGQLLIAPRENRLLAADTASMCAWSFDAGYPEVSLRSLFGGVWYENYPVAVHAWETTGHESFESKFGLMPLIFGTLKATLYSMLFATPIAILAAIYSSQFMHPRWRASVKPTIEMMASLPSVVLGFVAGLVFAPLVERSAMTFITGFFTVPLVLLAGAHLWQLLPTGWRSRLGGWRLLAIGLVALPAGVFAAWVAAPLAERLLFQGDLRAWLDGRGGSGLGGWVVALLPLAAMATAILCGRFVHPWLRRKSVKWWQHHAAIVSLVLFVVGAVFTIGLAVAGAVFLDALRLDTRGGLFGTYVQRNALIVAIGMSFAIIPLIFTIADDALSSVPDHLRSASLGAGATPWQTAVRVIMPAAASGLFSAVMIGLGRAVGETMIVLMAAGNTPLMGWNLFNGFQTLSAAIATELPEAARGSSHYRVLFLAALTLFAMTFIVNTAAELVRQRFRRRTYEL